MSDIRRFTIWGCAEIVVTPVDIGEWVRYDDHLVEVERMREDAERYRWLGYGPEFDRAVDEGRRKSSQEGGRDE
jgi:hypothetical protein